MATSKSLLLSLLSELLELSLLSELFVLSDISLPLSEIARSLLLSLLSLLSELLLPESAIPPTSKSLLLSELSVVAVELSFAADEPLSASFANAKLAAELSIRAILTASIFLLKNFIFYTPLNLFSNY